MKTKSIHKPRKKSVVPTTPEIVVEPPKTAMFVANKNKTPEAPTRNYWFLAWLLPLLFFLSIVGAGLFWGWRYVSAFEQATGKPMAFFVDHISAGWKLDPFAGRERVTILLLGLDEIRNQREGSMLTDTLMLVSIKKDGTVTLLSLPRDLWIDSLKTKINALYYYGEESEDTTGIDLLRTVVTDISGLPIDHHVVVRLDTVKAVIDTLGGIDLEVARSFEDTQFPRDDVDPATPDPSLLYETVRFEKGMQHFDGETALKYIRSRHSLDKEEGNDAARTARQHTVVSAVLEKASSKEILMNPLVLGKLYRVFKDQVPTTIDETLMVALAKSFSDQHISIKPVAIPIETTETTGIITNPPISKYKQWVYEPIDSSWSQFRQWITTNI